MLASLEFGPIAFEHPKTVLSSLIGLALLYYLFHRFALPGAKSTLGTRSESIAQDQEAVVSALEETKRIRDEYAEKIRQIEAEERERIAAAVRDAQSARDAIIADAEESARLLRRRADEEMHRAETRQRIELRRELVEQTLRTAEDAVRAGATDAVQHSLIADFTAMAATSGTRSAQVG